MGFMKPDKPKVEPPPPLPDPEAARLEGERELAELRRRRTGRRGTILTGAMGMAEEPTILTKKLLGG